MNTEINILIVGSCAPSSLENMYLRAFKSLGIKDVKLFNVMPWAEILLQNRIANRLTLHLQYALAESRLMRYLEGYRQSYDLILVFKGMEFSRKCLDHMRALTGKALWVNINPDDPFNSQFRGSSNQNVLDALSFYDVYCMWSKSITEKLKKNGCREAMHLPFGFDRDFHNVDKNKVSQNHEHLISFIGSWDKDREIMLEAIAKFPLEIFGYGWNRTAFNSKLRECKIGAKTIFGTEYREVMEASLIGINILRSQNYGYHNMRTFEIPATQTLMLSTRSEEQSSFFSEGVEAEYYSTKEELKEKCSYYLDNEAAAKKIAEAGYRRCLDAGYSYDNRAKSLLNYIF